VLAAQAQEWQRLLERGLLMDRAFDKDFPGLIKWGLNPSEKIEEVLYVIWKNPWMIATRATFIGSVLSRIGFSQVLKVKIEKYPKVDLEHFPKNNTLLLFSSEPFPFLKHEKELGDLGFPFAFVNGESFSWFGVRSLRFLTDSLR
jgi:hypothetical protein